MDELFNDKRKLACLAAIFFGFVGAHKFVLGYRNPGIIMATLGIAGILSHFTIVTALVEVVAWVEAFLYFQMPQQTFEDTYVRHQKPWF